MHGLSLLRVAAGSAFLAVGVVVGWVALGSPFVLARDWAEPGSFLGLPEASPLPPLTLLLYVLPWLALVGFSLLRGQLTERQLARVRVALPALTIAVALASWRLFLWQVGQGVKASDWQTYFCPRAALLALGAAAIVMIAMGAGLTWASRRLGLQVIRIGALVGVLGPLLLAFEHHAWGRESPDHTITIEFARLGLLAGTPFLVILVCSTMSLARSAPSGIRQAVPVAPRRWFPALAVALALFQLPVACTFLYGLALSGEWHSVAGFGMGMAAIAVASALVLCAAWVACLGGRSVRPAMTGLMLVVCSLQLVVAMLFLSDAGFLELPIDALHALGQSAVQAAFVGGWGAVVALAAQLVRARGRRLLGAQPRLAHAAKHVAHPEAQLGRGHHARAALAAMLVTSAIAISTWHPLDAGRPEIFEAVLQLALLAVVGAAMLLLRGSPRAKGLLGAALLVGFSSVQLDAVVHWEHPFSNELTGLFVLPAAAQLVLHHPRFERDFFPQGSHAGRAAVPARVWVGWLGVVLGVATLSGWAYFPACAYVAPILTLWQPVAGCSGAVGGVALLFRKAWGRYAVLAGALALPAIPALTYVDRGTFLLHSNLWVTLAIAAGTSWTVFRLPTLEDDSATSTSERTARHTRPPSSLRFAAWTTAVAAPVAAALLYDFVLEGMAGLSHGWRSPPLSGTGITLALAWTAAALFAWHSHQLSIGRLQVRAEMLAACSLVSLFLSV